MPEAEQIQAPLESTPPPVESAEEKLTQPGFPATPAGVSEAMQAMKDHRQKLRDDHDDPVVERKLTPEAGKRFSELSREQQLKAAGKMLSDQHKVEKIRAIPGIPVETSIADANAIEELIDSGRDPAFQRDWSQPGHIAKDRIQKIGLATREAGAVPHLDNAEDPKKPILTSDRGLLKENTPSTNLREANVHSGEYRQQMARALAADMERRAAFVEEQAAQQQPSQPQPQPQPQQPQPQAPQVDPNAQERARLAQQTQWNNLSHHERQFASNFNQAQNYIQQLDAEVRQYFTEYELKTGDIEGDERRAMYIDAQNRVREAQEIGQQAAINYQHVNMQRTNHEGQVQKQQKEQAEKWGRGEDAKFSDWFDKTYGKNPQLRAQITQIVASDPEFANSFRACGEARTFTGQKMAAMSALHQIERQQRAQVMEKINRPISEGGNTRSPHPVMRPGASPSANSDGDNAAADVRRLEKALENAPTQREMLKISAQLVKAKRAAGQIVKW
jgi:hypothetical protein